MRRILVAILVILGSAGLARAQNTYPWPSSGSVGIGTSSPQGILHIFSQSTSTYAFMETASASGNNLLYFVSPATNTGYVGFQFVDTVAGPTRWSLMTQPGANGKLTIFNGNAAATPVLTVLPSGNVGIGTAAPAQRLEVNGTTRITSGDLYLDDDHVLRAGGGNQALLYRSSANGIFLGSGYPSDFLVFNAGGTEKVRVTPAGSVGIGTTAPGATLDVRTTTAATAGTAYGSIAAVTSSPSAAGAVDAIASYVAAIDGNANASNSLRGLLGEAIHATPYTLPQARAVHARVQASGPSGTMITDGATLYADSPAIGGSGGIVTQYGLYINAQKTSAAVYSGYGVYQTGASDVNYFAGRLRIGTGSDDPSKVLQVNGDGNFTGQVTGGNIVAKYQDVAEWVPADGELVPGTVVVVQADARNHVVASTQPYDTSVAGVVSAQPGITLGEPATGKAKIATTGRVKVRVDANRSPIRAGDVLVTSDVPGTAMKSEPIELAGIKLHRPGTIVGKALEPLPAGRGEILVLLSLQ